MDIVKPLDLDSFAFGERAYIVSVCLSVCLPKILSSLRVRTWLVHLDIACVQPSKKQMPKKSILNE